MELEFNDILKASMVGFKFVAFRTPSQSKFPLPQSLFFTFNFYNFEEVTTEVVHLKTAYQIENEETNVVE